MPDETTRRAPDADSLETDAINGNGATRETGHGSTEAVNGTTAAAAPSRNGTSPRAEREHPVGSAKSTADRLLELVRSEGVELFKHKGGPYITVPVGDHRETYPVDDEGSFLDWLNHLYYRRSGGRAAPLSALTDAVRSLRGRAKFDGSDLVVHRRV